ncbi:type IV secretion system DNA-binding domain-containing protein [Novosphingobium sp. MD-1]|uniref:type IV secretion system DNA-binding domain-containing protein n=1 Tax=Novosphingobium sp. MD-1 TaxID=1630648 RepID=UPI00061C80C2|nr:type IV secretion system DNA-binding domain-containing protein [Novosphingobium sp. MD-1]GAO52977.1 incW plasmid conjugative protein trwB [Novosphingobium sp. MD-1]
MAADRPRLRAPAPWSGHGEARRNSGHFTRGSQLLGHQFSMWWRGARLPFLVWAALFALLLWARLTIVLDNGEFLMIGQRAMAWVWTSIGLSDLKTINITFEDGRVFQTYMGYVPYVPEVEAAWAKLIRSLAGSFLFSTIGAGAFAWAFVPWAIRRSRDMLEEHHERGAELADRDTLVARILANNNEKLRAIAARFFPDMTLEDAWALPFEERKKSGLVPSYEIATVPFPLDREQNHVIAFGTTGAGKTTALRDLITQALARGNSCVVFDLTGAFVESFYDPRRDFILNLNDERCEHWSVFHDCAHDGEFLAAAEALIPDVDGADGGFWEKAARTIFVEMCAKLQAEGKGTNTHLIRALMTATLDEIYARLKGTIADPLTSPKAERMANSVRGVFNAHAKALMFLPDEGNPFSIRDWAAKSGERSSILFVTSRYVDMPLNRPMLSMWMNIAIHGLMALPRSSHIRAWFFFDELGALHHLPAIEDGMQSARNYGGAFVLGVHSLASLRERYGDNGSTKLISLAYTKLILGTGDRDTAEECSKLIGYRQVRTMDEAYSYGAHQTRDASTISPTRKEEALVFPDDITNLENLTGYIRFREGFPAALIKMPYVDYPKKAEGFLLRPPPSHTLPPPADPAGDGEEGGGRDGTDTKLAEDEQRREDRVADEARQGQARRAEPGPDAAEWRAPEEPQRPDNVIPFPARARAAAAQPAPPERPVESDRTVQRDGDGKARAARADTPVAREERQPDAQRPMPETPSPRRTTLGSDEELQRPEPVRDKGAVRTGDAGQDRPGQGTERTAPGRDGERGDSDPNGADSNSADSSSAGQLARREAALDFGSDGDTHHHTHHAHDLDAGRDDDQDLGL